MSDFNVFHQGARVECLLTGVKGTSGGPTFDSETDEPDGWMYVEMDDGSIGEHDVVESCWFKSVE